MILSSLNQTTIKPSLVSGLDTAKTKPIPHSNNSFKWREWTVCHSLWQVRRMQHQIWTTLVSVLPINPHPSSSWVSVRSQGPHRQGTIHQDKELLVDKWANWHHSIQISVKPQTIVSCSTMLMAKSNSVLMMIGDLLMRIYKTQINWILNNDKITDSHTT